MNIIDAYASINKVLNLMLSIKIYPHSLSPNSYDATQKHTECRFSANKSARLS